MHNKKHNVDTIKLQIMFWILIFLFIYIIYERKVSLGAIKDISKKCIDIKGIEEN